MTGLPHGDGEIWSSALWHIRSALGDVLAGRIIIDAQFDFAPDTSFSAAARTTVAAALRLGGPQQPPWSGPPSPTEASDSDYELPRHPRPVVVPLLPAPVD